MHILCPHIKCICFLSSFGFYCQVLYNSSTNTHTFGLSLLSQWVRYYWIPILRILACQPSNLRAIAMKKSNAHWYLLMTVAVISLFTRCIADHQKINIHHWPLLTTELSQTETWGMRRWDVRCGGGLPVAPRPGQEPGSGTLAVAVEWSVTLTGVIGPGACVQKSEMNVHILLSHKHVPNVCPELNLFLFLMIIVVMMRSEMKKSVSETTSFLVWGTVSM